MTASNAQRRENSNIVIQSADSSGNVIGIPKVGPSQAPIRERVNELNKLNESRDREPGQEQQEWFEAERELSGTPANTVIVVDDQDLLRFALCEYLCGAGYEAFGAATAKEALSLLETHKAKSTILVTDLVLHGNGGWALTRWARERFPNLPIIFISGYIDESAIGPVLAHGNAAYLEKPFSFEKLETCLWSLGTKSQSHERSI